MLKAGPVANDKAALAAMDVFEFCQPADAPPPPGVEGGRGPLHGTLDGVARAAGRVPYGFRCDLLKLLLEGTHCVPGFDIAVELGVCLIDLDLQMLSFSAQACGGTTINDERLSGHKGGLVFVCQEVDGMCDFLG